MSQEKILIELAQPVALSFLTIAVGIVGFYLKRIVHQIDQNSRQIIQVQTRTESIFREMRDNVKDLRESLNTLWSTLIKN